MLHTINSFKLSPAFDVFMNFFPADRMQNFRINIKAKVGKKMETIYSVSGDLKVIETDE